jgi:hypothetical protein
MSAPPHRCEIVVILILLFRRIFAFVWLSWPKSKHALYTILPEDKKLKLNIC